MNKYSVSVSLSILTVTVTVIHGLKTGVVVGFMVLQFVLAV